MNFDEERPVIAHDPDHRWTNDVNMAYWQDRAEKMEARIQEALRRNFAAEEDIDTLDELTPLQAYERGVVDVQEFLLMPAPDTDADDAEADEVVLRLAKEAWYDDPGKED